MQCVNVQRVPAFQEDMPSQQNVICFLDPWETPPRLQAHIARTALVNLDTHLLAISSAVEIPVVQVLDTASPVVKLEGALVPAHISATRPLDMLGKHMQAAVVNPTADAPVTLRMDPVFSPPSCDEKKNHARSKPRTTPDSSTGVVKILYKLEMSDLNPHRCIIEHHPVFSAVTRARSKSHTTPNTGFIKILYKYEMSESKAYRRPFKHHRAFLSSDLCA